jgi:hypothetical protein
MERPARSADTSSQVGTIGAMRARDVSRPTPDDLVTAAENAGQPHSNDAQKRPPKT